MKKEYTNPEIEIIILDEDVKTDNISNALEADVITCFSTIIS